MCQITGDRKHALLDRIRRAGCPVKRESNGLTILQKGEAHIMDMGYGYVGIVLWMKLIRDRPGQIVVEEFGDIFLPWAALSVTWLAPLPISSRTAVYKLLNGFALERDLVLNDKLGESGITLRSGQPVEGYALGHARTPIPETYKHGALLDAQFSVIDVVDREHRGDVVFFLDRLGPRIRLSKDRPGTGLYGPAIHQGNRSGTASARQRVGGQVRPQDNAYAEAKVLRNSKEHLPPPVGTRRSV